MMRRIIPALAMVLIAGCVPRPKIEQITLEPVVIHAGSGGEIVAETPDVELDRLAELEDKGDCGKAIAGLQRFVEDFPESARFVEAVYRLGLCEEALEHYPRARGYYLFAARHSRGEATGQASLRAAFVLEAEEKNAQAAEEYAAVAADPGASEEERAGAVLRRAVCLFRLSRERSARRLLEDGVGRYSSLKAPSDSVRSSAAEARFAAAESVAVRFDAITLEYPQHRLQRRILQKARALVRASDSFLDVEAIKDADWSAAARYRIGELYEHFYDALVGVPLPDELSPAEKADRAKKTRAVAKRYRQQAFLNYLQVVALAERAGVDNSWTEKSRARVQVLEPELKTDVISVDPE